VAKGCKHRGLRDIRTTYDHPQAVLVYFWTCERCGERLGEARREDYQPRFDPNGNVPFLAVETRTAG
jgi:hypothetical protein